MPAGNHFTAVAAGSGHSLALTDAGTLVGWGKNDYGQANPPQGNRFVAVSAGGNHSLAIEIPEPSTLAGLLSLAAGLPLLVCCKRARRSTR